MIPDKKFLKCIVCETRFAYRDSNVGSERKYCPSCLLKIKAQLKNLNPDERTIIENRLGLKDGIIKTFNYLAKKTRNSFTEVKTIIDAFTDKIKKEKKVELNNKSLKNEKKI